MLEVITNNKPRLLLDFEELTPKEQAEFDYLPEKDGLFFRYRGAVYPLCEFMVCPSDEDLKGWLGYLSDTYFSGVLVKTVRFDEDSVIVGRYYVEG